jgi:PIN domain nuclease of toxin-antitoxin system
MADLLLDTHTLLWWQTANPRLSTAVRAALLQPESTVWVSAVSWWEIGIKVSLGRLPEAVPVQALMQDALEAGFLTLPIRPSHVLRLSQLPFPDNGHRNPFDRMLIAQALDENLTLLSADVKFGAYPVRYQF